MSNRALPASWAFAAALGLSGAHAAESAVPPEAARAVLAEAAALCAADGGELWGVSLCGPLMLVDPATRTFVASQNDAAGSLRDAGGLFIGTLPKDQETTNATVDWGGVHWARLRWPLPSDAAVRATLLMHESFHRAQAQLPLPLPAPRAADNAHLDTLDGRYLLQLEWRALAKALEASAERAARVAAEDALRFRHERRQLYPDAAENEAALELNEGLAQYSGIVLGNPSPEARTAAAMRELTQHPEEPDFVSAFAYANGPAYGLLLDRFAAGWRRRLAPGVGLDALLLEALKIDRSAESAAQLGRRASRYGGDELLKAEIARDARRRAAVSRNP
jgi:hypothetical protein